MVIDKIYSFLPKNKINNKDLHKYVGSDFARIQNYTGFKYLRIIKKKSDNKKFIFNCISIFLKKSKIKPKNIDGIIFCSHSINRGMPIFSADIQNKFNLRNNILCYDLPGSCSGFTNGLIHSYSFLKSKIVKNILLICADTHSKNLKAKNLKPVISDGVSCIFLKNSNNKFFFDIGVDGKGNDILNNDNSSKSLEMNGIKVLEFALKRVPETINNLKKKIGINKNSIDFFAFHQPNKTIYNFILKKLKIPSSKVIQCVNFGNTSAPSIPISLSVFRGGKNIKNKNFIFCGFGSGLSWSSIYISLKNTYISKVFYI